MDKNSMAISQIIRGKSMATLHEGCVGVTSGIGSSHGPRTSLDPFGTNGANALHGIQRSVCFTVNLP
jgi:hypothetical protein